MFAFLAFRAQAAEIAILQSQAKDQAQQLGLQRQLGEQQSEVLGLQAQELQESLSERKREAVERRSAQAAQVFITERVVEDKYRIKLRGGADLPRGPGVVATVHNTSGQPIYDTEFRWHLGTAGYGEPNPQPVGTVMPGAEEFRGRHFPEGSNVAVIGAVVRFRDAAGVRWLSRPDGELLEQPPDRE